MDDIKVKVYKHELHIYLSSETRNGNAYFTRTVKDRLGNIVYQATHHGSSQAYRDDPVCKFERMILRSIPEKSQCCCDRCSNFSDSSYSVKKVRTGFFRKYFQFVTKFLKIRK